MVARSVDKWKHDNYLKRARELYDTANWAFDNEKWNSCVINSIHSGISACDALCVFTKGLRYAGDDHRGAVGLFVQIDPGDDTITKASNQLIKLLQIKSDAEYGERLLNKADAESALLANQRFLKFVESRVVK